MNALRRLCLAIYSLLLIAAAGALIALAWADNQQFNWTVGGWNFQAFINGTDLSKAIFTVIMGIIAFIGLLTLILAILRETAGARRGQLRMRQADGGTIEVSDRAVEALLRDELERYPDVRSVEPRVRLVGGAVDTTLFATIAPNANIASVTSTLSQGVSTILRDQVGVTNVRRPEIRIAHDEAGAYAPAGQTGYAPASRAYEPQPEPYPGSRDAESDYTRPPVSGAPRSDEAQVPSAQPGNVSSPPSQPAGSELPPPPPLDNGASVEPSRWTGDQPRDE